MFQLPLNPVGKNGGGRSGNGSGLRGRTGGGGGLEQVMATNDDATLTKLSAVERGYYEDPFIQLFVMNGGMMGGNLGGGGGGRSFPMRQPPLMNRGYYSRVRIIRGLLLDFLTVGGRQVVNLGAGYDTTFFYLKSKNLLPKDVVFFELDLPQVVRAKIHFIKKHDSLKTLLEEPSTITDDEVHSLQYHLMSVDLRETSKLASALFGANAKPTIPTLFLSECVLIYMKSTESSSVIRWARETFTSCGFITYEQILPHDSFGQEMVSNLARRGCPLLSIFEFPDEEAQRKRYKDLGWRRVEAVNMKTLYQSSRFFDSSELQRVNRLEIFDELEEWHLIQSHYCIVFAVNHHIDSSSSSPSSSSPLDAIQPLLPSPSPSSTIPPLLSPSTSTTSSSASASPSSPRPTTPQQRSSSPPPSSPLPSSPSLPSSPFPSTLSSSSTTL